MTKLTELEIAILEKLTISCHDVEAVLDDYTEGALSLTLRSRIASHIHCCKTCQKNVKGYQEVIALGRELGENTPPMPSRVRSNLRRALNERLGITLSVAN